MSSNKPMNKFLFMFLGTIFNIVLMIAFFILFLVIGSYMMNVLGLPDDFIQYIFLVAVGLAFLCSFLVYRRVMKWAVVKFRIEESFGQKRMD